ncbi:MAG: hypothetical protein KDB12_06470, partial [Ilumatobacter sp.]|nr:hypothetical protein [Ilumatobacter sp.]
ALVACPSLVDAVALLPALRALPSLDAVELLMPEAVDLTCRHLGMAPPLDPASAGAFLLVDCAAHRDPADDLLGLLADQQGVLAVGPQREDLFRIRDHVTIALGAAGVPLKLDVAVPVLDLDRLVRRVRAALAAHAPAARLVMFGHLAEGNLHVNVLGAGDAAPALKDAILQAAIDLGGTISAEHGIGVAKTAWMERLHGPAHLAAMQAVKHALDPHGILNPGVLLPT